MSLIIRIIVVSTVILLSSCCHKKQYVMTESDRSTIENTIRDKNAEIMRTAEEMDAEKLFSFILENDKGVQIQNGKLILTRQQAFNSYKRGIQNLEKIKYNFDQEYITVISPNVALLVAEGESVFTTSNGNTFNRPFAHTTVYVLKDGEWKVLHAHQSVSANR